MVSQRVHDWCVILAFGGGLLLGIIICLTSGHS